jgi:membrane-associated protease RseP (regulator of RpoE activity)
MDQNNKNSNAKWIVLVVLAILLSSCFGALAGGAVGFWAGRRAASQVQQERQDWTLPFSEATPAPTRQPRGRMATPEPPESQLPTIYGALVTNVVDDSPADAAGIRVGDIIIAIDGESITTENTPSLVIGGHRPGDSVEITVRRAGQEHSLEAKLGSNPDNPDAAYLGIYYRLEPAVDDPSTH